MTTEKGVINMTNRTTSTFLAALLFVSIMATPAVVRAQENGLATFGSVLLSILHLPLKLVTCVGTQTVAGVAYVATYGVAGNYDGGTNGREIGEVARRSCTGDWIIPPEQVKNDYSS
jgi:hypothetical protein